MTRDGIEIHLEVVPYINPEGAQHVAYLWVDDADAFAQAWLATGAELRMPVDTEWNQHEGEGPGWERSQIWFANGMRGCPPYIAGTVGRVGTSGAV